MDHYSDVGETISLAGGALYIDAAAYSNTSTNEQKKDWFLSLNPNGDYPFFLELYGHKLIDFGQVGFQLSLTTPSRPLTQ